MVAIVRSVQEPDPVAALVERLDDPVVADSLNTLLDHADLLAVLVSGLSGLVSRGDTITDSISDGVVELRGVAGADGMPDLGTLIATVQRLTGLVGPLGDILPTIEHLMTSDLADPRVVDVASMASRAVVRGAASTDYPQVSGPLSLLRALKDDDVSRGLGFALAIAKSLGQELKAADSTRISHRKESH